MFDILTYILRTLAILGIPAGIAGIIWQGKEIIEAWKH